MKSIQLIILLLFSSHQLLMATDYYIHPQFGNDRNTGTSKETAFKTLSRASQVSLLPGDRILLAAGETFYGTLELKNAKGIKSQPIWIRSTPWNKEGLPSRAIIDAKGLPQGILIEGSEYLNISHLIITGDGYSQKDSSSMRVGVVIKNDKARGSKYITLDSLKVHDLFFENSGYQLPKDEVKTANGTQRYGWGIRLINDSEEALLDNIRIQNCAIENVDHTGIKLTGKGRNIQNVKILQNKISRTGGPGIQMSNVRFIYVSGNEVNKSGSNDDGRKWGRGSGLWTWSASNVLIEKNKFMNANGPGDSAGAHIDYNCDNVVLQYNFSAHNSGGFCEILGNNYNCAYRYNISVNDGFRIKGQDGAFQEGKTFWLSGYQGNKERKGPMNTYFYNNTIFLNEKIISRIAIDNRSEGVLIVNNIFYVMGESSMVKGDQYKPDDDSKSQAIERVVFKNNLFLKKNTWPEPALIQDESPLFGDPKFRRLGSSQPEDYAPTNNSIGWGIEIPQLSGDEFGLIGGLKVEKDFFGNKIDGKPGLGAISYK